MTWKCSWSREALWAAWPTTGGGPQNSGEPATAPGEDCYNSNLNNNIITWYPGPRAPRPLPARGGGAGPPAAGLARDRGHAHDGEALVTGVGGAVLREEIWTWLLVPGSSDIYHHYLEVSPCVGHLAVLGVRQLGALSLRPGGGHVNIALNYCVNMSKWHSTFVNMALINDQLSTIIQFARSRVIYWEETNTEIISLFYYSPDAGHTTQSITKTQLPLVLAISVLHGHVSSPHCHVSRVTSPGHTSSHTSCPRRTRQTRS